MAVSGTLKTMHSMLPVLKSIQFQVTGMKQLERPAPINVPSQAHGQQQGCMGILPPCRISSSKAGVQSKVREGQALGPW